MSYAPSMQRINKRNTPVERIAYAVLMTLALGSTTAWAFSNAMRYDHGNAGRHALRADMAYGNPRVCRPANGAQILGGFASPNDWLDPATDEICNR